MREIEFPDETAIAVPTFKYVVAPIAVKTAVGLATLAFTNPLIAGVVFGAAVVGVGLYIGATLLDKRNASMKVINVPKVGLPYTTSAGVQLNLGQITSRTTPTTVIEVPSPSGVTDDALVVEKVALDFDEEGAFIRVNGRNFGTDSENLLIEVQYGTRKYQLDDIVIEVPDTSLRFPLPETIPLEITDLPTGQLAEAQVTHYTEQGIPNGGTILIDHNANGLGWFIDPTPLDH